MSTEEFKSVVSCCIINGNILTSYFYSVDGFLDKLIILRNLHNTYQNEMDRPLRNSENIKQFTKDIKVLCKKNMIEVDFNKYKETVQYSISGKDINDLIYLNKKQKV